MTSPPIEFRGETKPMLLRAAFALETLAHLRGLESELLPVAEQLRFAHALCEEIAGELVHGLDDTAASVYLTRLLNELA